MLTVTNGEHTIEVSRKAFDAFYAGQGYAEQDGTPKADDGPTVPALKAALEAAGVEYPKAARKPELLALFATIPPVEKSEE